MRFPSQNSATSLAIQNAVHAMAGLLIGLFIAVWSVPGVPHTVITYLMQNIPMVLAMVGIPTAVVTFIVNFIRSNVPNY